MPWSTPSIHIRLAALLAAATTTFGVMTLLAPAAQAATVTVIEDGMTFTADDASPGAGATVTDYDAAAGPAVTIPASVTISGVAYDVKGIGPQAFREKGLTSVAIDADLTSIGPFAFEQNSLTSVTIPNTVTTIGGTAFAGNDLTSIVIPDSVTSIAANVFAVNNIATAKISKNLTTIPESMFELNDLTSITIPEGVTSIGTYAFLGNALTDVDIPSAVTSIGLRAFDANPGLTSVNFDGAAPTIFDANTSEESFDTASGSLVVHHRAELAAGFGNPWHGYTTKPYLSGLTPGIGGNPREGYTLTALPGPVDSNANLAYQWKADGVAVAGGTSATLQLRGPQAGRRISVTVTATYPGADPMVRTSGTTRLISSPYKHLVVSKTTVKRGTGFAVTATGFKPYQKVKVILNGKTRFTGRADATGMVNRWVTFKSNTKAGVRSVRVSGYSPYGTIVTWVRYVK